MDNHTRHKDKFIEYDKMFSNIIKIREIDNYGTIIVNVANFFPKKEKKRYDKIIEYLVYIVINALKISKKNNLETMNVLVNLNGCSMNNYSLKFFRHINDVLEKGFPDTLNNCSFYSNSKIFTIFWAMMSKYIDPVTKQKVSLIKQKNIPSIFL